MGFLLLFGYILGWLCSAVFIVRWMIEEDGADDELLVIGVLPAMLASLLWPLIAPGYLVYRLASRDRDEAR